ncbi:hypothetical protein ABK040_010722 [Willaertia magna]
MSLKSFLVFCLFFVLVTTCNSVINKKIQSNKTEIQNCQVLIVGGSTSALAAALSSASEKVVTCLIEPTDWVGGQLTSSGVPAIDFAWENQKDPVTNTTYYISTIDKAKENVTPNFYELLNQLIGGDSGKCWVSNYCYLPKTMIEKGFKVLIDRVNPYLKIFYNTVVKRVYKNKKNEIIGIDAIQRSTKASTKCDGYDVFLSKDIRDWYDEKESNRYEKNLLSFSNSSVYIEASEWGELMALSNASFLQGLSERYDGDVSGIGTDTCGQSIVYGFAQKYNSEVTKEPDNPYPVHYPNFYSLYGTSWDRVWTYRRLFTSGNYLPSVQDITLQNWGKGNDFQYGYLFLSREDIKKQLNDWMGGVNITTLIESEYLAYGWHYAFKKMSSDADVRDRITLDKTVFGTCHGLCKVPYIRDTKRSIGLDDFVMKINDITGTYPEQLVGNIYYDHIAIGTYSVDIHVLYGCKYPSYMLQHYKTLPFFIPFRAMTNRDIPNLLVTGKTLAQSFLTNAATRLHPVEWSSGTATGVAAAFMVKNQLFNTRDVLKNISSLQKEVEQYTPIRWTINNQKYPPMKEKSHLREYKLR